MLTKLTRNKHSKSNIYFVLGKTKAADILYYMYGICNIQQDNQFIMTFCYCIFCSYKPPRPNNGPPKFPWVIKCPTKEISFPNTDKCRLRLFDSVVMYKKKQKGSSV